MSEYSTYYLRGFRVIQGEYPRICREDDHSVILQIDTLSTSELETLVELMNREYYHERVSDYWFDYVDGSGLSLADKVQAEWATYDTKNNEYVREAGHLIRLISRRRHMDRNQTETVVKQSQTDQSSTSAIDTASESNDKHSNSIGDLPPLTDSLREVWDKLHGESIQAAALARACDTTEDAIRQRIRTLKSKGYAIENAPAIGYYRLDALPAGFDTSEPLT